MSSSAMPAVAEVSVDPPQVLRPRLSSVRVVGERLRREAELLGDVPQDAPRSGNEVLGGRIQGA